MSQSGGIKMEVIQSGANLGAEIRGVDLKETPSHGRSVS